MFNILTATLLDLYMHLSGCLIKSKSPYVAGYLPFSSICQKAGDHSS